MSNVRFPNKWLVVGLFTTSFLYNQIAVSYEEENLATDDVPAIDDMPVEEAGTPEQVVGTDFDSEAVAEDAAPVAKTQLPKETVSQKKARAKKAAPKKEMKKEVAAAPVAEEKAPATTTAAETTTTPATTEAVAQTDAVASTSSDKKISDGSPITIDKLGVTIAPPVGWEVLENSMGMTLVMQEPAVEEKVEAKDAPKAKAGEEKLLFQRNITVVAMHESAPIDENEATKVKEKITEQFGKQAGIENFQVLEHKFFDYKNKNDGMVIYTAFTMNSIPMTQMHVLVSGQNNRFLLTYTDLSSEFEANQEAYQKAWTTMSTIQVIGDAPVRYADLKVYGGIAAGFAFLVGFLMFYRRRRAMTKYAQEDAHAEPSVSGGETSSLWSLDGGDDAVSGMAPISAVSHISEVGQFNFGDNKEDCNDGIDFSDVTPLSKMSRFR